MRKPYLLTSGSSSKREAEVILTDHAIERAQKRGVTQGAVYWTSLLGEPRRAVGGAFRRTMTKKSAERLIKYGLSPADVSRYLGTVVITRDLDLEERLVITVRPTEKSGKRRGGRHRPNSKDSHMSHS